MRNPTPQVHEAVAKNWEAWNPWELLRALPASFIRSLDIGWAHNDHLPITLGHALLMAAGVKSSTRFFELHVSAELLTQLREKCRELPHGVRRLKQIGRFCLRYPIATRNILINARLGERFTEDGRSLSETTQGVENFLLPGLPADLSACLKSAVTCYLGIGSLVLLAAPGFLRATIAPLDSFERIRHNLQNAMSELRRHTGILAMG